MADKKKPKTRPSPGMSIVFKDALRALGFGPVVDRKKDIEKQTKKGGA